MSKDEIIKNIDEAISELVYEKTSLMKAYNYYNCKRDPDQFRHLEENYGIGTPTQIEFTPLVRKHIDALVGEYTSIPTRPKISCKDDTTLSNIMRDKQLKIKEEEFKLAQQQAEDTRNQYIQTVVNASKSISDFHETVEIDDNDRESLLEFIFDTDPNGLTQIQKALQDPSNVVKVAWYLQHGDDMIKQVHQYYQSEIAKLSKQNKVIKPETVIKPNQKNQHTTRPKTINDLYV